MLGWRVVFIFFGMTFRGLTTASRFYPKLQTSVVFDPEQPSTHANPSTVVEKENKDNLPQHRSNLYQEYPYGYLDNDSQNEIILSSSTSPNFQQEENQTPPLQEKNSLSNKSSSDIEPPSPSLNMKQLTTDLNHVDPAYYFQYNNKDSRREENADSQGSVFGSYSYSTGGGNDILVEYRAGPNTGFVIDNWDQLQAAVKRATKEGFKQNAEKENYTVLLGDDNQNNPLEFKDKDVENLLVEDDKLFGSELVLENQHGHLQQSESNPVQYMSNGQVGNGKVGLHVFMGNNYNLSDGTGVQGEQSGKNGNAKFDWAELESTTKNIKPSHPTKQPQWRNSTEKTIDPVRQAEEFGEKIKENENYEISYNLPVMVKNDKLPPVNIENGKLIESYGTTNKGPVTTQADLQSHDNEVIIETIDMPTFPQSPFQNGPAHIKSTKDPQQVSKTHPINEVYGIPTEGYAVSPLSIFLGTDDFSSKSSNGGQDSLEFSSVTPQVYNSQRPFLEWSRPGYQGGYYNYLDPGTGQTVIFRQQDGRDGYLIFGPE